MTEEMNPLTMTQKRFERRIQDAREIVEAFTKRMESDGAAYAFAWAQDAMEAASVVSIYTLALDWLNRMGAEKAAAELKRACLRNLENPCFSTAPCANLMHQIEGKTMVKAMQMVEELIEAKW
jgi:hypothetical protein